MPNAIVLRQHGGPETLRTEPITIGAPGRGEIRLRQTAIGVNFHDIYVRSGLYASLTLPGIPGIEAAGIVEAIGADVTHLRQGDRVAYVTGAYGAYAQERLLPADLALRLPDKVDERTAAALILKGLTARMLLHRVHRVVAGDIVLVHAAAGGVGRLLVQWARHLGATVIGTVGSEAKAEEATRCGAHHVILYRQEDFVARVRAITKGRGVDVAYDSVGHDTFQGSLDSLALLGHLVNFGQSSGPVEPFRIAALSAKSNSVSRPMLFHYIADRPALEDMAAGFFTALADGILTAGPIQTYDLADVAAAHRDLEARRTTGSVVLLA